MGARRMMSGESTCRLGFVVMRKSRAMRAVITVVRESSTVRAIKTDTAGWRNFGFFGWSSKDGYWSQGGDEEGEEGREMHAGCC